MRCRLCDHDCAPAFERMVLHRLTVQYYSCPHCGALQSETPTWLDEAYGSAIAALDTGIVARNLVNQAVVFLLARILGPAGRLVDFGGGTGMLCRLLRDIGFDAYLMDRYADPVFARGFGLTSETAGQAPIAILSCFELFEHLSMPDADLAALFALKPALLVASTKLCDGKGADWAYAGWFIEMLGLAECGWFPIVYADYDLDESHGLVLTHPGREPEGRKPTLPLPPPGEAEDPGWPNEDESE